MAFKRRIGSFLILFGLVALLVFAASLLAGPDASFDVVAFLAAVVLLALGFNLRLSKPMIARTVTPPPTEKAPKKP